MKKLFWIFGLALGLGAALYLRKPHPVPVIASQAPAPLPEEPAQGKGPQFTEEDLPNPQPEAPHSLGHFAELSHKAVRTADEDETYRKALQDASLLRNAIHTLLARPELSQLEQTQRYRNLDYLKAALAWQDNPNREEVIRAVKSLVLDSSFQQFADTHLKKSAAGDKIELLLALVENKAVSLDDWLITYAEHPNKKLFQHAFAVSR